MENKRLFLAVPVPEQIKQRFAEIRRQINIPGNWTHEENLHLTVHFLGNTPVDRIREISKNVRQAAEHLERFDMEGERVLWKKGRYDEMTWAKIRSNNSFRKLAKAVFSALDLPTEKLPVPHITLARIKQRDFRPGDINISLNDIRLPVKALELWESKLGGGKPPVYTSLEKFRLNG